MKESKKNKLNRMLKIALTAAIYVTLTLLIAPLSYGVIQFRIAEVLTLLCFYKKDYCYALILGCVIANLFSPLGILDLCFGVLSTIFSVIGIRYCKKLWTASLFPTVSMVFIAWELTFVGEPFWFSLLTTAIGEFVVVSVLGVSLFRLLESNKTFAVKILKLKLPDSHMK